MSAAFDLSREPSRRLIVLVPESLYSTLEEQAAEHELRVGPYVRMLLSAARKTVEPIRRPEPRQDEEAAARFVFWAFGWKVGTRQVCPACGKKMPVAARTPIVRYRSHGMLRHRPMHPSCARAAGVGVPAYREGLRARARMEALR